MTLDEYLASEKRWDSTPHVRFLTIIINGWQIEILRWHRDTEKAVEVSLESSGNSVVDRNKFWMPKAAIIQDWESVKLGIQDADDRWGGIMPLAQWFADKLEAKQNLHIISTPNHGKNRR